MPCELSLKEGNALQVKSNLALLVKAIMPSKYTDEIENSSYIWRAFKIG